jgi:hypothetical protein
MDTQQPAYRNPPSRRGTARGNVTIRLATVEPSPDVFAAVMATGILSVAAADHRYTAISEALGVIASLGLVLLVLVAIATRRFSHWDLKDPAADLLRPAPDQQSSRNAALRRCVVGVRLPPGHVLRGQLCHGRRDRATRTDHGGWSSSGTRWRRGSLWSLPVCCWRAARWSAGPDPDAGRPQFQRGQRPDGDRILVTPGADRIRAHGRKFGR